MSQPQTLHLVTASAGDYAQAYRRQYRVQQAAYAAFVAGASLVFGTAAWVSGVSYLIWVHIGLAIVAAGPLLFTLSCWLSDRQRFRLVTAVAIGLFVVAWATVPLYHLLIGSLDVGGKVEMSLGQGSEIADREATLDPQAERVMAALAAAKAEPGPQTFRALVPFMLHDKTNLEIDGELVNTAATVRLTLDSDRPMLYRALHEEATSLLPYLPESGDTIPARVPERVELCLNYLLQSLSERKIADSFDVPTVGIKIRIDQGLEVSEREIAITYPFADYMLGDMVFINQQSLPKLLAYLEKELGY